ncbi:MAG: hypothetical protein ACP5M0_05730 [Desulfomonilaceae bacterium]
MTLPIDYVSTVRQTIKIITFTLRRGASQQQFQEMVYWCVVKSLVHAIISSIFARGADVPEHYA